MIGKEIGSSGGDLLLSSVHIVAVFRITKTFTLELSLAESVKERKLRRGGLEVVL